MIPKIRRLSLDDFALVIIGLGAAVFYYYFEKNMATGQDSAVFLTMGIIMMISLCTQLLVNSINRSNNALAEANETSEIKVKERTAELRESEMKYRTIFENTGAATVILEKDMTISLANAEFASISGYAREEIENRKYDRNEIKGILQMILKHLRKHKPTIRHQTDLRKALNMLSKASYLHAQIGFVQCK